MPISERDQFTKTIEEEKDINPVITPKHDPNCTDPFPGKFRTILNQYASGSLINIIKSPDYNIHQFQDHLYGSQIIVAVPKDLSTGVSLGYPSGSCRYPSANFNCLALPSGSVSAGYHAYAECYETIADNKISGRWTDEKILSEIPPEDEQ